MCLIDLINRSTFFFCLGPRFFLEIQFAEFITVSTLVKTLLKVYDMHRKKSAHSAHIHVAYVNI